jgi:hypothetical protein
LVQHLFGNQLSAISVGYLKTIILGIIHLIKNHFAIIHHIQFFDRFTKIPSSFQILPLAFLPLGRPSVLAGNGGLNPKNFNQDLFEKQ